jgi:acetoacetate decarboxylase
VPGLDDLPSGFIWTDARILLATVPLNAIGFGDWLPPVPGLRLANPPLATCFVARYPKTLFGSVYNEAAVLVHVVDDEGPALHCPWMVVDDDTALVFGRELLGFPKKMARIRLTEGRRKTVGSVVRKGVEVLRIEAQTATFANESGDVLPRLLNAFGSFVGGMSMLDIPEITERVHERGVGSARLTARATERDPIGDWVRSGSGEAVFSVLDFAGLDDILVALEEPIPQHWATVKTLQRAR